MLLCMHAKSHKSCLTLCNYMDCSPTRLLCPWDSLGNNTGVGCHFLFQGIFLTQGLNPHHLCFLNWHAGSLPLAPPGKPHHVAIGTMKISRQGGEDSSRKLAEEQLAQMVKNLPAMQDWGSIPGWGRSLGGGNGYPLQYFCLENSMDRRTWWSTVNGVAKSPT